MFCENGHRSNNQIQLVCLEDLVPQNHLVRKLEAALDLSFIREELRPLYSKYDGRPAIDTVVLFKILILGFVFGIRSVRQTMREAEVNMAYRWYLGYDIAIPLEII